MEIKKNIFSNKIGIAIIVALLVLAIGLAIAFPRLKSFLPFFSNPSAQEIEQAVKNYLAETMPEDIETSVSDAKKLSHSGVYQLIVDIGGTDYVSYVTEDGKFLFPQAINLEEFLASVNKPEDDNKTAEVKKQARPDVKLFVMSYCPFGLQAEKALLPAWKLLEGKADIGIYFVDYVMHEKAEVDENLRQYCIQKNEPNKFLAYLDCFSKSGDFQSCMSETGVDQALVSSCEKETDSQFQITENYENKDKWLNGEFPKFNINHDLDEKYGVDGSPTVVINGQVVNVARTPDDYKQAICNAFEQAPEECSQTLSALSPAPGFGSETTDSGSEEASCND